MSGATMGRAGVRTTEAERETEKWERIYAGNWPSFLFPENYTAYSLVPRCGGGLQIVAGEVPGAVTTFLSSPLSDADGEDGYDDSDAVEALKVAGVIHPPVRPRGHDAMWLSRQVGRAVRDWHRAGHDGLPPAESVRAGGYTVAEVRSALAALHDEFPSLFSHNS